MKDLLKAFVTDLKEEGFTQGELASYILPSWCWFVFYLKS